LPIEPNESIGPVIVMITGEEDRTVMRRAFEAGVELFLFKPVERNKLLKLMRVAEGPIERERRRFTRVKVRRGVSIESDGQPVKGTTLDLSMGGMLVQASYIFPLGSAVRVNLELKPGTSPLLLTARVVRVSGDDCMGLEFHNVAPKEGNALQEFLLPLIVAG
jgi:c-di-GMP-binding flagellar brake protein YcgR